MEELEAMCRAFIWRDVALNRRKAPVAWNEVCKPLKKGGLGVLKLREWNLSLLSKLVWDISLNKENYGFVGSMHTT